MCGRPRVFGRVGRCLFGEVGREAFVKPDHGDVRHVVQGLNEAFRLARLLPAFAAEGQWEPDDDAVDLVLADQGRQTGEPVAGRSPFDDTEWSCNGAGGVRNCNAGARPAVVECENLHFSAAAIACFPASSALRSPSGFLPPA